MLRRIYFVTWQRCMIDMLFDIKSTYRFRISRHCCFMDGYMRKQTEPLLVKEDIRTPIECMEEIRKFTTEPCFEHDFYMGESDQPRQSCLPDQNILLALPRNLYEQTYIMLRGDHCACKLFVYMYDCSERGERNG